MMGLGGFLNIASPTPTSFPSPSSISTLRSTSLAFPLHPSPLHFRTVIRAISTDDPTSPSSSPPPGPDSHIRDGAARQSKRQSKRPKKETLQGGLRRYETMAILRPDISEDDRIAWTQRYEEAIIAGGGLDIEFSNRGMMPLAYNISTKDTGGLTNKYVDGIYMLFTYVTKPESQLDLQKKFNADDDIIRSTTLRLK